MSKTILTLLLGIGVGLLIAPAKGSDTWRNLMDGLDDYKDRGGKKAREFTGQEPKPVKAVKRQVRRTVK